jgi:hypothetical protein
VGKRRGLTGVARIMPSPLRGPGLPVKRMFYGPFGPKVEKMFNEAWFNSAIGISGLIISILSVYFYLNSIRKPLIGIYKIGYSLIDYDEVKSSKIEAIIDGQKIDKLIKTSIYIWNKGNKVLRNNDIAEKDKLRIVWSENELVYNASIGKVNNKIVNAEILNDFDNRNINISFDYLNPKDGMRIDILHNSFSKNFNIEGTIIGTKRSIKNLNMKDPEKLFRVLDFLVSRNSIKYIIIPIGIVFLLLALLLPDSLLEKFISDNPIRDARVFLYVMAFLYFLLVPMRLINSSMRYPKDLDE